MTKKLSILIPTYNETEAMVKRLLDSIALQQRVNFDEIEVLVMHDGNENTFKDELFKGYPFDVNYYIGEHRGVSATRNKLLTLAKGEYIQWCDADDFFHSAWAFFPVFREMKIGFDVLVNNFLQETPLPNNDKEFVLMEMQMNGMQFVHGKTLRRGFLIENEICFRENYPLMDCHEDHVIMALARAYSQNIKFQPCATYTWAWNENSVCRKDPYYLQHTTKYLLMNNSWVLEKLYKKGKLQELRQTAYSMFVDMYYSLCQDKWLEVATEKDRAETEGYFKFYYNTYKKYADELAEDQKKQIELAQKQMHTMQGLTFEKYTWAQWFEHLKDVDPIEFEIKDHN